MKMLKQIRSSSPGFAWWDDLWGSCAGRLEEQPLASGCVYPDLPGMQTPHPLHLQLQKDTASVTWIPPLTSSGSYTS